MKGRAIALVIVGLGSVAAFYLDLRPEPLLRGWPNLMMLGRDAFPPQLGLLPVALRGLLETLAIAYLGTLFGFVLALPLGLAGARTLTPRYIHVPVRILAGAIRTLPALLWAVVLVIVVGFKPLAGVLAMTLYAAGHLAKLQYESFEQLPAEPIEGARAAGARFLPLVRMVVLPESANLLIAQLLYIFEYNVRASSIIGFVGAGGIGTYLHIYLQAMQYDGVLTLLVVLFATVVVVDLLSLRLRSRFLTRLPGRPQPAP